MHGGRAPGNGAPAGWEPGAAGARGLQGPGEHRAREGWRQPWCARGQQRGSTGPQGGARDPCLPPAPTALRVTGPCPEGLCRTLPGSDPRPRALPRHACARQIWRDPSVMTGCAIPVPFGVLRDKKPTFPQICVESIRTASNMSGGSNCAETNCRCSSVYLQLGAIHPVVLFLELIFCC